MFNHLHCHSHYSLLDGLASPEELIKRAVELKQTALALTDHGNMFGAIEFYTTCKEYGIKPIIGMEAYVAPIECTDKKSKKGEMVYYHITILAKNEEGYQNLIKLATLGYTLGFYYKPRIDIHLLRQYKEGLIILSGCMQGLMSRFILADEFNMARATILDFEKWFGDNFYLELQDMGIPGQDKICEFLQKRIGHVNPVVTNDVHYINKEDARAHDALLCIGTGKNIYDDKRLRIPSDEMYLKSEETMLMDFSKSAVERSAEIADRCDLEIKLNRNMHITKPQIAFFTLKEKCDAQIHKYPKSYQARYDKELEAIQTTGYAEYLLVVADFMEFARHNAIPVGSGRGSSAGSIVCYLLGITEIDPITNGLIFERFINKERIEPPDIDVDVCQARRGEIIEYLKNEYGWDRVAQIVSFGSMKTKQAIRDTCRVLQISYMVGEKITKMIPISTESVDAFFNRADIKDVLPKLLDTGLIQDLHQISRKIEGRLRHSSTHAAGVVIANCPLTDVVPLCKKAKDDGLLVQYDMYSISKIGLLKFDILGLKTITVINETCQLADIDKHKIPLDDSYTYVMLQRGNTFGIFQYAGWGYTRFIKEMQPRSFNDLIHLGALFRPGLLDSGMAQEYIERMHGKQYDLLDPSLLETYGIILYQEQVMNMAVKYAGFTMNKADILRKAIGKKDKDLMDTILRQFKNGMQKNKHNKEFIDKMVDTIITFARYGWNKAHAVSYALLSYQTAFLKFNYSTEFFCALLNSDIANKDKLREILIEATKYKVKVKPPHVNISDIKFNMRGRELYAGLLSIKGIGEKVCQAIVIERHTHGKFKDQDDLRKRIPKKALNIVAFKALIAAGALK